MSRLDTREITFADAIREAISEEMRKDERIFVMGEDVQIGMFGPTRGLADEFGRDRVRNTPISESAFVGAGAGATLTGMRPIVEVQHADFLPLAFDQIVNQIAKMRFMHGATRRLPLVIRTAFGAGQAAGPQHSQSPYSWLMNVSGLKLVMPSTPYDAKGLMKSSLRDDNPTIFWEHKLLYSSKGPVPQEEYIVPIGKADVKRTGKDVTAVAIGAMVQETLAVSKRLERSGIMVEAIDLRTLVPMDIPTIVESVKKTRKLVVVDEAPRTCGAAAEIMTAVLEQAFEYLDAAPIRVTSRDIPVPFSPVLEKYVIPDEGRIESAIRSLVN